MDAYRGLARVWSERLWDGEYNDDMESAIQSMLELGDSHSEYGVRVDGRLVLDRDSLEGRRYCSRELSRLWGLFFPDYPAVVADGVNRAALREFRGLFFGKF